MYRIELSPGEETAFRTIEELAVAIRRGIVTARARVWHNASGKWLPINVHPHYKAAAAMQLTPADLVAGAPVKPLELLSLGAAMEPAPAPARAPAPPAPAPPLMRSAPEPAPEPLPRAKRTDRVVEPPRKKPAAKSRRGKSGGNSIRVALIGALLIGCAHLAFSAVSTLRSEDFALRPSTHRRLVSVPAAIPQQSGPETTAAAVLPGLSDIPTAALHVNSAPAITKSEAATPTLNSFREDSEPAIQPAPDASIDAPLPTQADPIARKTADSTDKKTMKKILRTISGSGEVGRSH
jgi:hypothetical protein